MQVRYLFKNLLYGNLDVYGGVNNLDDAPPQQYLSGNGDGSGIYDTLGRTYYLGVVYDLGE